MKKLYTYLINQWRDECPKFWIDFQKICYVVGGSSALMTGEFKAMLPTWIFPVLSAAAFIGAFLSKFTSIPNETPQ